MLFSYSVISDSLRPHRLQHTRPRCPSPTPGVYSNTYPLSQWCHPTISSSVVPFSSCLQSFPASGSLQMSQLFIRWPKDWSCSFSINPSNDYSGLISFRIDRFDLLAVQGTLESFPAPQSKSINSSVLSQLSYLCMTTGKNHSFDYVDLCWQSDVSAFQYIF